MITSKGNVKPWPDGDWLAIAGHVGHGFAASMLLLEKISLKIITTYEDLGVGVASSG